MGGSLLHLTRGRLRRRPQITGTGRSDTAPQYRKMLRGPRSLGNGVPTRPAADVTTARLPNYRWGSAQRISFLQQQGNMRTRPAIAPRSRDNSPGLRPAMGGWGREILVHVPFLSKGAAHDRLVAF